MSKSSALITLCVRFASSLITSEKSSRSDEKPGGSAFENGKSSDAAHCSRLAWYSSSYSGFVASLHGCSESIAQISSADSLKHAFAIANAGLTSTSGHRAPRSQNGCTSVRFPLRSLMSPHAGSPELNESTHAQSPLLSSFWPFVSIASFTTAMNLRAAPW